jgi:hypothetical protein
MLTIVLEGLSWKAPIGVISLLVVCDKAEDLVPDHK